MLQNCQQCGDQVHTENAHAVLVLAGDSETKSFFCSVSCLSEWCKAVLAAVEADQ